LLKNYANTRVLVPMLFLCQKKIVIATRLHVTQF